VSCVTDNRIAGCIYLINCLTQWNKFLLDKLKLTQSRNSPPSMEQDGPLTCSHRPTTGSSPQPGKFVHILSIYLFKIHSDIFLPSASKTSKLSLPFRFFD